MNLVNSRAITDYILINQKSSMEERYQISLYKAQRVDAGEIGKKIIAKVLMLLISFTIRIFTLQRISGLFLTVLPVLAIFIVGGEKYDVTPLVFLLPLGLFLILTKKNVLVKGNK